MLALMSREAGAALIRVYVLEWQKFADAAKYINHLLRYMNRHYVQREIDEGSKTVLPIGQLCHEAWRDVLLPQVGTQLVDSILALVKDDERGYGNIF